MTDKKVLVVDDDIEVKSVIEQMLKLLKVDFKICSSGEEAIEILNNESEEYSIILLDLYLPGIDGLSTFKEIIKCCRNNKIYVSSGYGRGEKTDWMIANGAAGVLAKPYRIHDLKEILENC